MARKLHPMAAAALMLSPACALVATAAPRTFPSHCEVGETTVFSCSIGRKVASVCATDDIGPSSGRLRYAFGPVGKPELAFPAAGIDPRKAFTYGLLAKGDYVRFRVSDVTYVVFSHMQPGVGDMEGVVVTRRGRPPVKLVCRDGGLGEVGWQPVYRANLPRDEDGFDVP